MHPPSNQDFMAAAPDRNLRRATADAAAGSRRVIRSQSHISRLASDESWIEVASQPSSSSLSSTAPEEVITTGLRVAQSLNPRRRRRLRRSMMEVYDEHDDRQSRPTSSAGSSQEEYDESESGSDRALGGSNLEYQDRFLDNEPEGDHHHEEEEGMGAFEAATGSDDETALGVANPSPVFTPQPNAFSHPPTSSRMPPSSRPTTTATTDSYFPPTAPPSLPQGTTTSSSSAATTSTRPTTTTTTTTSSIPSRAHTRTRSHTPYSLIQPSHTVPVDHDAALRASLSTLLSCAAAARGLPKRESHEVSVAPTRPPLQARVEPSSFRLVSESALDPPSTTTDSAEHSPTAAGAPLSRTSSHRSIKRTAKSPTRDRERRKKRRATGSPSDATPSSTTSTTALSPTLLTWVVGAGVMVLFSALSFSAGYALGREVGRIEAGHMGGGGVGGIELGVDHDGGGGLGLGFLERSTASLRRRVWSWGNASGMVRA